MTTFEELRASKTKKKNTLEGMGIPTHGYSFSRTDFAQDITADEKAQNKPVRVCGKILAIRNFGKIGFLDLQDATGKVQIQFKTDYTNNDSQSLLGFLDVFDYIGVHGIITKTNTGEASVLAKEIQLLSKSIAPAPDKWNKIKDPEIMYRQRYLDLVMNHDKKNVFRMRSEINQSLRETLLGNQYIEIEIPILQPLYGGANARPFKSHSNALEQELFLCISPELYLKRAIMGNIEKVFTIIKCFRNEDIDRTHNPEFTMLECYEAYADYNHMMALTETLYRNACEKIYGTAQFTYNGVAFDLSKKWDSMTMHRAIESHSGIDTDRLGDDEIFTLIEKDGKKFNGPRLRGLGIAELFSQVAEKKLIQPTHITDHPFETSPLCKEHRTNPLLIERFESFINGWEICNAYSELTDPIKQRKLLELQAEEGRAGEEMPIDEEFISAMEYGMPPTGGLGIGVDRMAMLLLDQPSIQDVILFPQMRTKK